MRAKKRGGTDTRKREYLGISRDDIVMVTSGSHKGKSGKVLRVLAHQRKVVVQNVNMIWKHLKKSQQNPQGGRLNKEAALPIAKVMVVCGSCDTPTKVYRDRNANGARRCKRCDALIGERDKKK